jgi:nucleoside-diphosphate-sugar epimerase
LFNTVGRRQTGRYGVIIPTFVRQALNGEPIKVFGTASQSCCFIDVGEVVDALIKLAKKEEAIGQFINLGRTQTITITDLAKIVKEATGSNSVIINIPYDAAYQKEFEDIARRIPDISKERSLIGFNPENDLIDIIKNISMDIKNSVK